MPLNTVDDEKPSKIPHINDAFGMRTDYADGSLPCPEEEGITVA